MSDETTKKADPTPLTGERTDKVEELPEQQIAEGDAQAVKGGRAPEHKIAKK